MNDGALCFEEGATVPLAGLVGHGEAVRRLRTSVGGGSDRRYFGLSACAEPSCEGKLGHYVGTGRLPEFPDRVLRVSARRFSGADGSCFDIDYIRLYAVCAADPEVSRQLDRCLTVYPDEAPVQVADAPDWAPLIALAYINALHHLVHRHLRRGFVTRDETLRGRVRGQIRMGHYIAQGLARGHPDAAPCRFQAMEHDTLENRILRTALAGAKRILNSQRGRTFDAWQTPARQADVALAGVGIVRIEPGHFRAARRTGAYRHYATALALAKGVLTHVGFDPNQPLNHGKAGRAVGMIPFRLATAELFECYVEACLRAVRPRGLGNNTILTARYESFPHGEAMDRSNESPDGQRTPADRPGNAAAPSALIFCYPVAPSSVLPTARETPLPPVAQLPAFLQGLVAAAGAVMGQPGPRPPMVECFAGFAVPLLRLGVPVPLAAARDGRP